MRVIGTVASKPTSRSQKTKYGDRIIHECAVLDEDGGIVSLQQWSDPAKDTDPFAGLPLEIGTRIVAKFTGPTLYQGVTRATLAEAPTVVVESAPAGRPSR